MALTVVRSRIGKLLQALCEASITEASVAEFLRGVCELLAIAGVPLNILQTVSTNFYNRLAVDKCSFEVVQKALFYAMCDVFQPCSPQRRNRRSVVFFGLEGASKSSKLVQYARYCRTQEWIIVALLCCYGHSDEMEQAAKGMCAYYYPARSEESSADAVRQAAELSAEKVDLFIIDSKEQPDVPSMVNEARRLTEEIKPQMAVFLVDSSVGYHAAFEQARLFQENVQGDVAAILTSFKDSAQALGTLAGLAAAKCPVLFLEVGDDLQAFDAKTFVGDLMDAIVITPLSLSRYYPCLLQRRQKPFHALFRRRQDDVYTLEWVERILSETDEFGGVRDFLDLTSPVYEKPHVLRERYDKLGW